MVILAGGPRGPRFLTSDFDVEWKGKMVLIADVTSADSLPSAAIFVSRGETPIRLIVIMLQQKLLPITHQRCSCNCCAYMCPAVSYPFWGSYKVTLISYFYINIFLVVRVFRQIKFSRRSSKLFSTMRRVPSPPVARATLAPPKVEGVVWQLVAGCCGCLVLSSWWKTSRCP